MIVVAEYHNQSKLRFWCQMVLPLVYDDSLSYMELLNKVVNYLNNCIQDVGNCETKIESLLEAFVNLQDYVNSIVEDISPEIEATIDQMIENGDFTEILTDALNVVLAPEYDETHTYIIFDYCLHEGKLYRANGTTTGTFDSTKWVQKTVCGDLSVIENYVYSLDAGDIAYNPATTYNNGTVGKELGDLKDAITEINDCLEDKTIVLLGDSNAYNWGATNPFSDIKNVTFHNLAVGGASFTTQNNNNIEAQYNSMASSGYAPDYVIIWAGGNDLDYYPDWGLPELGTYTEPNETTTFESIRRLLSKLRVNYPSAKLLGIVRDNKPNTNTPVNRFAYVMGIIEHIYEAWKVPVLSFDSISNITQDVQQSKEYYMVYEAQYGYIHYNAKGLKLFTDMIKNALRNGLVTHCARRIEILFAPSNKNNANNAALWVFNELFKGTASWNNWWLEQKNYKIYYVTNPSDSKDSWIFDETFISVYSPAIGIYSAGNDGHWYVKDNKTYVNRNSHEIFWYHECEENVASLKNIPSGMVTVRLGQMTNTVGLPTEFKDYSATGGMYIIGAWKPDGWYNGIICLPFTANLNNMFTMNYNASTDVWEFWAADHSAFYSENGS